ncbi:DEAD/DEAH box helicase [Escherichia coli]
MQAAALPAIPAGKDVRVQAKTGSGKTADFGLGLLQQIDRRYFKPRL